MMRTIPNTFTLILLASITSFAAVIVTPAVPAMALAFHVASSHMEWVLSLFLLGYALGQLLWGPLSDKYGRRPIILLGLTVGVFAALVAIVASLTQQLSLLFASRFLMGLGLSSGLVMSMAMIVDTHDETQSRKKFSLIVVCFAVVPAMAIICGGILIKHYSAVYIELLIAILSGVCLLLALKLKETLNQKQAAALQITTVFTHYLTLLRNTQYLKFITIFGLAASVSYVFNSLAPLIAIQLNHVNAQTFSMMSLFASVGIFLGAYVSNRLSQQFSTQQLILVGSGLMLVASVAMTILFLCHHTGLVPMFGGAVVVFFGMSLIIPNASMSALHAVKGSAAAAGLMNAFSLTVTSILTYGLSMFVLRFSALLPLAIVVVALSIVLQLTLSNIHRHG